MYSVILRLFPSCLALFMVACSGAPVPATQIQAHVERTGNFRGSAISAMSQDGAVAVMFQPPLPTDNDTLLAAIHDALKMYFDVDTTAVEWRPIKGMSMRFETQPQPLDVTPIKDEDSGRLAGLLVTQPAQ